MGHVIDATEAYHQQVKDDAMFFQVINCHDEGSGIYEHAEVTRFADDTVSAIRFYDEKKRSHRLDGPAVIAFDQCGSIEYMIWNQHGLQTNSMGPAFVLVTIQSALGDSRVYYKNAVPLSVDDCKAFTGLIPGTPEWEFTWEMISTEI